MLCEFCLFLFFSCVILYFYIQIYHVIGNEYLIQKAIKYIFSEKSIYILDSLYCSTIDYHNRHTRIVQVFAYTLDTAAH